MTEGPKQQPRYLLGGNRMRMVIASVSCILLYSVYQLLFGLFFAFGGFISQAILVALVLVICGAWFVVLLFYGRRYDDGRNRRLFLFLAVSQVFPFIKDLLTAHVIQEIFVFIPLSGTSTRYNLFLIEYICASFIIVNLCLWSILCIRLLCSSRTRCVVKVASVVFLVYHVVMIINTLIKALGVPLLVIFRNHEEISKTFRDVFNSILVFFHTNGSAGYYDWVLYICAYFAAAVFFFSSLSLSRERQPARHARG